MDGDNQDSDLPSMVAYKIRMDSDRIDTTAKYKVLDK